jgi:uncharacterized protein YdeI (YjbR/CyaY-like superfamily)
MASAFLEKNRGGSHASLDRIEHACYDDTCSRNSPEQTAMKNTENLPILFFETQQDWEEWLKEHHHEVAGVWLKLAKKDAGLTSLTYAQGLESALCYGWIDGQKASGEHPFWLQKFTPRRPKSLWSQVNREKAAALIAAGRMQPAGLRQVELAQADGRWDQAYASQSRITIPADFQSELDKNPQAQAFFHTLDSANRYAILFRIQTAKRAETRAARIQQFLEMLVKQEKLHP